MAEADLRLLLRTIADNSGAEKTSAALRRVQQDAAQTNTQMLRGVVASAAGFVSLTSAASAFGAVLRSSIDAQRESERVGRATAAAYGGQAAQFTRFAASLSAQTGFASDAILEAALSARTLSTNYGLSIQQTQELIRVSADLARIRGIGVAEAFERVQSAIRGEAEASEYLGLTLNDTYIKNNAMNGSLKNTFETMSDGQKAQVRYNELLKQTADFNGLAAQSADSLDGAFSRVETSTRKLQLAFGALIQPGLIEGMKQLDTVLGFITAKLQDPKFLEVLKILLKGSPVGGFIGQPDLGALTRPPAPAPTGGSGGFIGSAATPEDILAANRKAYDDLKKGLDAQRRTQSRLLDLNTTFLPERDAAEDLARLAYMDQLEAAVRDLVNAQLEQKELQQEGVELAAREAQIRLGMLPAMERMATLQRNL